MKTYNRKSRDDRHQYIQKFSNSKYVIQHRAAKNEKGAIAREHARRRGFIAPNDDCH
jgi:hypothetical protein